MPPTDPSTSSSAAPIVVVGAGAAGLVAAIHAAAVSPRVVLLERTTDGGRKILISGGGRCNVLPSELSPPRFVTASSPNSLRKMLLSWPLPEQRAFFEQRMGLALELEEETGKLFPATHRARDVRDGLVRLAREAGVELRFDTRVRDVVPVATGRTAAHDSPPSDVRWIVRCDGDLDIAARSVVLATGGLSVPATGSDGTGLRVARRLGHEVHDTYPALTPLTADPPVHAALAGVSLPVTLTAPAPHGGFVTRGGFLFTHRGYSGPAVLDISHVAVRARLRAGATPALSPEGSQIVANAARRPGAELRGGVGIGASPDAVSPVARLPRELQPIHVQWTEHDAEQIERMLSQAGAAAAGAFVRRLLPQRLADTLLEEVEVPPGTPLSQLRRDARQRLTRVLSTYDLPWSGDEGYKKAEVTGGGVSLADVDPRTLESRKHSGLYLCGEMLDAFGPIGGYNFAWAFATGRLAGRGSVRS